jgi:membrane peptidoglycan carboxypeptidase
MLAKVGIKDVLSTATDMGITTLPPTQETLNHVGLSLTLGGGEIRLIDMADAYSAFVNKGARIDPVAILKVTDANGKILEDDHPQKGKQVLTEQQAYIIDSILSDNDARTPEFGANSYLNVSGLNVMVKTGTTNDKRDNWTIGGNDNAMVGVWVGNNDNSPMLNVASGISGASPIWHKIIVDALAGKPKLSFDIPGNIITAQVDSISGYAAHDGFPSRSESFIKGTEPTGPDPVHVLLKVCKSDGNLANPSDVSSGNYDTKEFFIFKEEDPTAAPGGQNKWQEGILNWLNTQGDARYHPPTSYCGTSNPLDIEFNSPHDETSNMSTGKYTVNYTVNSTSAITQSDLRLNDSQICTFSNGTNNYSCEVNFSSNGVYLLKAEATDAAGHQIDRVITVGVGMDWNVTPSPSPTATP